MTDPVMKFKIVARAELALAQIRLQRLLMRSALFAVGLVFALLGLGMFNIAAFYALSSPLGYAMAALIVALVDCAIMVIILLVASKTNPMQGEEKLAKEIRDLAGNELQRDFEKVKAEVSELKEDLRKFRSGILAIPTAAVNTLLPLLKLMAKSLSK